MGNFYIENKRIKLGINLSGGSLVSFVDKKRGEEMLWQADARYWPNHDVVLFPLVGIRRNEFVVAGEKYEIETMHGFARTQVFEVAKSSEDCVLLEIKANAETLKQYPFNFKLGLEYQLLESGYKLTYIVESLDGGKIPFYVGGHAAINMPQGETKVVFEAENDFYYYPQAGGTTLKQTQIAFENAKEVIMDKNLFVEKEEGSGELDFSKGCMLERNFGGGVTVVRGDGLSLKYDIGDCSCLTLWGFKEGGDYFCVEPWWGIKQMEDKETDLYKLPKINIAESEPFKCHYSVEIIDAK